MIVKFDHNDLSGALPADYASTMRDDGRGRALA
jgi:hypothetical protein